ncbi:MAG: HD domain-containing protein, partial [Bdellovibrionota bacterium]
MNWEPIFEEKIRSVATVDDPAHDLAHFKRVVATAKRLAEAESARLDVVVPAAWLHDLVIVPKNDPRRSQASRLSGEEAKKFLDEIGYPKELHADIAHAVEAHSFSANIEPRTKEAAVVQDADRLDGLGAIGLARVFATAGLMKRAFYSDDDPFCTTRK